MPVCFMPVKLCGNIKWIGELDLIMQRESANLLCKKVQNKRGEQVNFAYDFELEHTTERTCETCFTLTCQENIELVGPIKIQNDCDS